MVQRIGFSGMSPELQQRVQNRLTVREGDTLGRLSRLQDELQQIDEHLTVRWIYDPQRANVILFIMLPSDGVAPPPAATVAPPPGVYRIGAGVNVPVIVSRVEPEYTEQARNANWQGTVLLQVTVDENGVPQDIQIVRALGLGLDQKAIEAVQKWRFKPALLNGKPVPVSASIEVNFRLL